MDPMTLRQSFSTREAADLAAITYRQLDYWCRIGAAPVQADARGSGSRRRFSLQDVCVIAVLAQVGGYVQISNLFQLATTLKAWEWTTWDDTVLLIDRHGDLWRAGGEDAPPVAFAVNLAAVLDQVRGRVVELHQLAVVR